MEYNVTLNITSDTIIFINKNQDGKIIAYQTINKAHLLYIFVF